jgi:hypothetical protein
MADENLDNVFESIFGKDERSDAQRKLDSAERLRNKNESDERLFERDRDRRLENFQMDQRIRRIAQENTNSLVITLLFVAGIFWSVSEFGWLGGITAFCAFMAYSWWDEKHQKKSSRFRLEDVHDLAEDTVTHERIAEMAEAAENWIEVKGGYVEWGDVFEYPYWERVNNKVRNYVSISHTDRMKDNAVARAASLSHRIAKTDELKALDNGYDLPYRAKV